jgi:nonsense-mediated mRNA decay protein 3
MSIQERFCPKCGKPSENDGLCNHCLVENTKWFICDRRVISTQCPSCGAIKQVNTWSDYSRERADLAVNLARSAIHFHKDAQKPSINVTIIDKSQNRSLAILTLKGLLYTTPVEGTCAVEIVWHKEQCDRCNRISGSYHEGVVQIRAEGRTLSAYEKQVSAGIAQQVEDSLQAGGERLSFISEMTETRDGLDIIIGSQHIGLLISQQIVANLGGRYTTHPKLVGEKAGRQLYRITYSVRLPRFQKEDVIFVHGRYAEVERVEAHHLRIFDLTEGVSKSVRESDIGRHVGNARNAKLALVAYTDAGTIGILDPESHTTVEVRKLRWLNTKAGQHIGILRDGDQIVVVR